MPSAPSAKLPRLVNVGDPHHRADPRPRRLHHGPEDATSLRRLAVALLRSCGDGRNEPSASSSAPTRAAQPPRRKASKFGCKPKLSDHQQVEALKRLAAGKSCRHIGMTIVHHSTISKLRGVGSPGAGGATVFGKPKINFGLVILCSAGSITTWDGFDVDLQKIIRHWCANRFARDGPASGSYRSRASDIES